MDEEEMGDSFKSQEQQVGEAQSLENIAVETGASSESQQLQEASLQNPSISSEIPPAASSPAAVNFNMPFKHPFSNDQLKTLLAMLETFFAQLDEQQQSIVSDKYSSSGISPPLKVQDSEAIQNYLCINKSPPVEYYNKLLVAVVQKLVTSSLPDQLSKLQLLLRFLSNSWGTFLLLGARRVPFYDLSIDEREVGLLKLADSRFEQIRAIFKAFKALTLVVVYGKSSDPMLKGIGYEQEKSDPDAKYIPTFMSGKEIVKSVSKVCWDFI